MNQGSTREAPAPANALSIVIIAYNEERYLPALLDSLSRQTQKSFEVLVVDSGSSDRTREIALAWQGRFSAFRLVELGCAKGPGFARNRGAEQAAHRRLLFLDADSILDPGFIEQAAASLSRSPADLATCFIRVGEGGFLARLGALFLNGGMILMRPIYLTAYGGCLFSTRELHTALGGFNEHLAICEDCDYVKRAVRAQGARFRLMWMIFSTSDRRARSEGPLRVMLKYLRVHLYRLTTRKEIASGSIAYDYGDYTTKHPAE